MALGDGLHDVARGKVAMAVTYLEMHAPADLPIPHLADGLNFRRVNPQVDSYRTLFKRVGADWLWYGRLAMPDAELEALLNDPLVQIHTLTQDSDDGLTTKDEAILELDFRQKGQCELAYFGLTSKLIGTGAGRFLMAQANQIAWDQNITRFHVHTCTIDSPQALGFYIRSGFTPYRRQVEVDDDPRTLGLLPETAAPHVPLIRP